ncbi:MAG: hypothetical protein ABFE13_23985, partial [Phycisphaerales bacterium]
GHDACPMQWGFRDWTAGGSEYAPNRLSLVVGDRPVLIGNDLSGVSVVEIVPRVRQVASKEM